MNWSLLLPGYLVTGLAAGVLTLDLVLPRFNRALLAYGGALLLAAIAVLVYVTHPEQATTFAEGILYLDSYSLFFFILFIALGAATVLGSAHSLRRMDAPGEFVALLVLSVVGAMGMAAAGELLTAYISLELLSFALYVLASSSWQERRTNEAGTKYILLGALASAFLLLGISYLYGLTGTTRYEGLASELSGVRMSPGLVVAVALVTAGLGFKVAVVPFHMWTPDVYEGAPIPVVAYLAAASKVAGFALLLRLVAMALAPLLPFWDWALLLLAVLSMVLGNLVAIHQGNLKRLMAYSSIGQAGYMLLGVAALGARDPALPVTGLLFHMAGYAATTLAAFFVILEVYNQTGREGVRDLAGLAERSPYLAMVLTAALFSLAGFPFFVGFASKFYLFAASATAGPRFLLAVGIAILASLVSLYYYLLIIRQMYMERPEGGTAPRLRVPASTWALLALLLAAMVVPGLYPGPLVESAASAAAALFPGT